MKDDGTRGPEWAKMVERHKAQGITSFHVTHTCEETTCEEIAHEMNKLAEWFEVPQNMLESRIGAKIFTLSERSVFQYRITPEGIEPLEYTPAERRRMESDEDTIKLLQDILKHGLA
jgi:tyrosine-protein phosphatase YwqE